MNLLLQGGNFSAVDPSDYYDSPELKNFTLTLDGGVNFNVTTTDDSSYISIPEGNPKFL
jgi:hypothetical protein